MKISKYSAVIASVAAVLFPSMGVAPAYAAPSPGDATTLFVAPSNECSDSNPGTKSKPICSLSTASDILDISYAEGQARGDIEIRFKAEGNRTYNLDDKKQVFDFAPATGKYVRFLPDWYTTDAAAYPKNESSYVQFHGKPGSNTHAFVIQPKQNRGGSYEVAFFDINKYLNGIRIAGGTMTKDPDDTKKISGGLTTSVERGKQAPINTPIIRENVFRHNGNIYVKDNPTMAYGLVRIANTTNAIIKNNRFFNYEDTQGHEHAIYAHTSAHPYIEGNIYRDMTNHVVRFRQVHSPFILKDRFRDNAAFTKRKETHISTWYRNKTYQNDGRFAECRENPPVYENTGNNVRSHPGDKPLPLVTKISDAAQQQGCNIKGRVTAPASIKSKQVGYNSYSIDWEPSLAVGTKVKNYHVYLGQGTGPEKLVATLPASKTQLSMNSVQYKKAGVDNRKEMYYIVRAETEMGSFSPRTSNKTHFELIRGTNRGPEIKTESIDKLLTSNRTHITNSDRARISEAYKNLKTNG